MDLFSTAYHLRCCSKSSTPAELLKARLHAIEFVTLPDSFWLDWLDDALNEGDSSHLPMVISAAISMRPSEQVIRCCASCLATPTLPHDIRRNLVEACIDVAGYYPGSAILWDIYESLITSTSSDVFAIEKCYVDQLSLLPNEPARQQLLLERLSSFRSSHNLPHSETPLNNIWETCQKYESSISETKWSDYLEFAKLNLSKNYCLSIFNRASFDLSDSAKFWTDFISFSGKSRGVLERAVRALPRHGNFWQQLLDETDENVEALRDKAIAALSGVDEASLAEVAIGTAEILWRNNTDCSEAFTLAIDLVTPTRYLWDGLLRWLTVADEKGDVDVQGIIEQFLAHFTNRLNELQPLQWIQLAAILKSSSDDVHAVTRVYKLGVEYVNEKYRYIVAQDWLLFARVHGSLDDVRAAKGFISKSPETVSDVIEPKKRKLKKVTLFIKNLDWRTTEDTLNVTLEKLTGFIPPARILRDMQSGRSRGLAYADFASPEDAHAALSDLTEIDGRTVTAEISENRKVEKRGKTVLVKNLDFSVDESQLREFFKFVVDVEIPKNHSGKSRGFAFVSFADSDAAAAAVLANDKSIGERKISVEWSTRELTHKGDRVPKSADFFKNLVNKK